MSRNVLLTVKITVSSLEDKEMPIQVEASEPVAYEVLETLFTRVLESCREHKAEEDPC